ncbi:unnamed protein product [Lasius platythorax]|uniref:BTB domain-containing protein n=1 Tax=Lasius platythorax TaxID=488582 RepID=A0AAV2NM94_9HYME
MFGRDWTEKDQSVIEHHDYSYIVYKSFLKYLYTGVISLPMQELLELLDLAIVYCETKLERCCIQEIKRGISIQNIDFLRSIADKHKKEDLKIFCLCLESRNS